MKQWDNLFTSYCYGPADIEAIKTSCSTTWLYLRDSVGQKAQAIYRGCLYRQLHRQHVGTHLSLVQQLTAGQLLARESSPAVLALRDTALDAAALLETWERQGYAFYLHVGTFPESELLIVAQALDLKETV